MKYKLLARGMSIKRQRHCQGSKNHPIPLCSPYAVGRHGVSALSAPGSGDTGALMVWLAIREGLAASGNRQLLRWGSRSETSFPPYAVGRHGVSALSAPGSDNTGALMVWLAIREGLAASGNRQLCWRLLATQNFAVVVRGAQADGVVVRGGQADGVAGRIPNTNRHRTDTGMTLERNKALWRCQHQRQRGRWLCVLTFAFPRMHQSPGAPSGSLCFLRRCRCGLLEEVVGPRVEQLPKHRVR